MKEYIKRWIGLLLPLMAIILFLVLVMNYWVLSFGQESMYQDVRKLKNTEVGLVFGASVKRNLEPSTVLKDRLIVAAKAYELGKVQKIIVSGDNSEKYYNEPLAMQQFLLKLGVSDSDIYLDYAGFDTYDSIYRAKHIFGADELVFFTQDFQLKRAIYIAERLGIKGTGVFTNLNIYANNNRSLMREVFARVKAFLDVEINSSKPKFLGPLVNMDVPQQRASKSLE